MFEAAPLRGPQERVLLFQEGQVVIEAKPGFRGLGEQGSGLAVLDIDLEKVQCLLVARLPLHRDVFRPREPVDACEIDILLDAQVQPRCVSGIQANDTEIDFRVRRARRRVALQEDVEALGENLETFFKRYRRFVDARIRDRRTVRRPPVTRQAVHLLLRNKLGHAVLDRAAAVGRQLALFVAVEIHDVQILLPYERHVAPVG